jgi:hypothetical protein
MLETTTQTVERVFGQFSMNLTIIDNFLPYPNVVRSWALSQNFYDCKEMSEIANEPNTWPGLRSFQVTELDADYANVVLSKIASIATHYFGMTSSLEIKSSFQVCRKQDGDSWIHVDNDVMVAGILYLTPDAPVEAGTTIYSSDPHVPVDVIGNIYNRLVMYNANLYHKSNMYFGTTLENSRLTQVFFVKGLS